MKDKGRGMPYFNNDHWEKKPEDVKVSNLKYATEFGNPEDLKESVNKLSDYVKKNKMKY
jgi:hypothetical protein